MFIQFISLWNNIAKRSISVSIDKFSFVLSVRSIGIGTLLMDTIEVCEYSACHCVFTCFTIEFSQSSTYSNKA